MPCFVLLLSTNILSLRTLLFASFVCYALLLLSYNICTLLEWLGTIDCKRGPLILLSYDILLSPAPPHSRLTFDRQTQSGWLVGWRYNLTLVELNSIKKRIGSTFILNEIERTHRCCCGRAFPCQTERNHNARKEQRVF